MDATSEQITVIEPERGWKLPDLREIWRNYDLIYFLARRDIVARYRQAVVGTSWALLQPLLLAGVFSVFLGVLAKVPSEEGIPYSLFAVSGMVIWIAFATCLEKGSSITVTSEGLLSKVYFPRFALPISAVIPPTVDFLVGLGVLVAVAAAYGFYPTVALLAAPLAWGLAVLTALGIVLWFSALNVRFRDITLLVPFLTLIGLFVTPIIYPFDLVPESLQALYALNPMVGVLELFRWSLLGTDWPGLLLLIPTATSILLLVSGALYFERAQRDFADYL